MKKSILFAMLFAGLLVASCVKDEGPVSAQEQPGQVTFDDVLPVFQEKCTSCHNTESAEYNGHLDLTETQAYGELVNKVSYSYAPAVRVVPGNAGESVLIAKIKNTGEYGAGMPLSGELSGEQIELIENWVNSGAEE